MQFNELMERQTAEALEIINLRLAAQKERLADHWEHRVQDALCAIPGLGMAEIAGLLSAWVESSTPAGLDDLKLSLTRALTARSAQGAAQAKAVLMDMIREESLVAAEAISGHGLWGDYSGLKSRLASDSEVERLAGGKVLERAVMAAGLKFAGRFMSALSDTLGKGGGHADILAAWHEIGQSWQRRLAGMAGDAVREIHFRANQEAMESV